MHPAQHVMAAPLRILDTDLARWAGRLGQRHIRRVGVLQPEGGREFARQPAM